MLSNVQDDKKLFNSQIYPVEQLKFDNELILFRICLERFAFHGMITGHYTKITCYVKHDVWWCMDAIEQRCLCCKNDMTEFMKSNGRLVTFLRKIFISFRTDDNITVKWRDKYSWKPKSYFEHIRQPLFTWRIHFNASR